MELRQISFNEYLHKYTDQYLNEYKSVTTVIGDYIVPFDRDKWSKYSADKEGKTQAEILRKWDKITDTSLVRGNGIHKELENGIEVKSEYIDVDKANFKKLIPKATTLEDFKNSELQLKYPTIYEVVRGLLEQGWVCYSEFRIYTAEHLIAGTIDCLFVRGGERVITDWGSVVIKGAEFKILDWKTNKDKLSFQSGYFKKVNGKKTDEFVRKLEYMLYPITHIEHCKGSTYTLQLSLYARIMELWGNTCTGLALCHIRPNTPIQFFKLPYWKESCDLIMNDRLTKINN